jgi:hypothetical protein
MALIGFIGLESLPLWANIFFWAAIIWSIPWKGIALWNSARNRQKIWFIVFLIVNTIGILEILYLLFWRKKRR